MRLMAIGLAVLACAAIPLLVFSDTHAGAAGNGASRVVFTAIADGDEDIWSMNPDGSGRVNLTPNNPRGDYQADISRDGTLIAYASDIAANETEIFVMNPDGSDKRRVTTSAGSNFDPGISPDNKRIVFYSTRDGVRQIYLINLDGAGETRLTHDKFENRDPAFSPDGRKIIFVSNRGSGDPDDPGDWHLYTMNVDGSGITALTSGDSQNGDPTYSPDGRKIVFTSNRDYNPEIYLMNADGTGVARLTNNTANDGHPAFSPDGKKIVFHSNRDDSVYQLYVIGADGKGERRITRTNYYNWYPTWGPAR